MPQNDQMINLSPEDLNPGGVNDQSNPGTINIQRDVDQTPVAPQPPQAAPKQIQGQQTPNKVNLPEEKSAIVSPTPTVPMFAPDGTLIDLPSERVHEAIANGGSIGVPVIAPDGTHIAVPAGRLHEAMQHGAKIDSSGWTPGPSVTDRATATVTGPGTIGGDVAAKWQAANPKGGENAPYQSTGQIAAPSVITPLEAHEELSKSPLAPVNAMTEQEKQDHPVVRAGLEMVGGLTSPENLAIMVGSGVLGKMPGPAGQIIGKALSAGFSLQAIAATAQHSPKFLEALARGDENEAQYELSNMVLSFAMAEQGAEHVTDVHPTLGNAGVAAETSANALGQAAGEYAGKAVDAAKNIPGAGLVKGAAKMAAGVVTQPISAMTEGPEAKITRAAGGSAGVQERDFQANIPRALKYITEENKTNPIKTPEDMAEAAHAQKTKLWDEQLAKPHPGETIDGDAIAQKLKDSVNPATRKHDAALASQIDKWADTFKGPYGLDEAMGAITKFNSDLRNFYKQSPSDQFRMAQSDPKLGMLQDAADTLRDAAFTKLSELGEKNIPELRKDYGALNQMQRIFEKRAVVYGRQAPIDFKSSLGAIAAAASGHPIAAAVPFITKYLNSPEHLLQSAISKASKTAEVPKTGDLQVEQSRKPVNEIRPPGVEAKTPPNAPANATSQLGTMATPSEAGKPAVEAGKAKLNPTAATEGPVPGSAIDLETRRSGIAPDFHEQKYPHTQSVRVEWPEHNDSIEDQVKGLNKGHALYRAEQNWPGAKITPIEPSDKLDLETGKAQTEGVRSDFRPYDPENPEGYEPRINAPADRRANGTLPGDEHIHEWGHITNAAAEGWGTEGIKSHLSTTLPGKLTTAAATVIPRDIDWKDPDSVARNSGKVLSVVLGGAVAQELHSGIPFEQNQGSDSDIRLVKNVLRKELGFTDDEIDSAIKYGRDRATRNLTQPGISDMMLANSKVREAGLDPSMHASPERTEAYAQEVRRIQDANRQQAGQPAGEQTGRAAGADQNGADQEVRGVNQPNDAGTKGSNEGAVPAGDLETGRAGLKESTTGDDKADEAIKSAGAIPAGKMMNLAMFHDPETGSTLALDHREVTPELVKQHLQESREKFGVKPGKDIETGRADDEDSLSNRLVETFGTTNDHAKAGFILADGRMVPLKGEHNTMLDHLYEKYGDISQGDVDRSAFINNEGAVRTRFRFGKGGNEVAISVPKNGVTPEQIDQLRQSVAAVGRYGNAVMEIGEGSGASTKKEFATPRDVEPMLREIGAHPDQRGMDLATGKDEEKEMTPELAKQIADAHAQNDGSTFNLTHGDLAGTDNYAVATHPDRGEIVKRQLTPEDVEKFAAKNQDLLGNPDKSIGTWHDTSDDSHTLDVVSTLADREKAIQLGKDNNQKAIYHLKTGETIPTGGTGAVPGIDLETGQTAEAEPETETGDASFNFGANAAEPGDKATARAQKRIADWKQSPAFHSSTGGTPEAPAAPPAPAGHEDLPTVSTRTPGITANKEPIDDHTNKLLTSDMQAASAAPGFLKKLADRVSDIPGFKDPGGEDHEARTNAFIRHVADNTKFVQSKVTPEEFATDSQWYPVGAHERGIEVAKAHGLEPHQAYAVTAALSPLTDWDQNTAQAERAAEIWKNQQDTKFTPEMKQAAKEILTVPEMQHFKPIFKSLEGKTLGELPTLAEQAWWLRLYEEGHYDRSFQTWNPDGTPAGLAKNADGTPKSLSWSFQSLIENAINIMKDGSQENISRTLGDGHKVRNFYNNQLSPDDPRFLTIDTHQVNIGQLRPMSGSYPDVADNFGSPQNAPYGLSGTYPMYDAGTRLAAKELGIDIPSRLQSSGWVKIRKTFPNRFKTEENLAKIDSIWKEHTDGKISANDAREKIWDFAERWNRDAARKVQNPGDEAELPQSGVRREATEGDGRRSGGDVAEPSTASKGKSRSLKPASTKPISQKKLNAAEGFREMMRQNAGTRAGQAALGEK